MPALKNPTNMTSTTISNQAIKVSGVHEYASSKTNVLVEWRNLLVSDLVFLTDDGKMLGYDPMNVFDLREKMFKVVEYLRVTYKRIDQTLFKFGGKNKRDIEEGWQRRGCRISVEKRIRHYLWRTEIIPLMEKWAKRKTALENYRNITREGLKVPKHVAKAAKAKKTKNGNKHNKQAGVDRKTAWADYEDDKSVSSLCGMIGKHQFSDHIIFNLLGYLMMRLFGLFFETKWFYIIYIAAVTFNFILDRVESFIPLYRWRKELQVLILTVMVPIVAFPFSWETAMLKLVGEARMYEALSSLIGGAYLADCHLNNQDSYGSLYLFFVPTIYITLANVFGVLNSRKGTVAFAVGGAILEELFAKPNWNMKYAFPIIELYSKRFMIDKDYPDETYDSFGSEIDKARQSRRMAERHFKVVSSYAPFFMHVYLAWYCPTAHVIWNLCAAWYETKPEFDIGVDLYHLKYREAWMIAFANDPDAYRDAYYRNMARGENMKEIYKHLNMLGMNIPHIDFPLPDAPVPDIKDMIDELEVKKLIRSLRAQFPLLRGDKIKNVATTATHLYMFFNEDNLKKRMMIIVDYAIVVSSFENLGNLIRLYNKVSRTLKCKKDEFTLASLSDVESIDNICKKLDEVSKHVSNPLDLGYVKEDLAKVFAIVMYSGFANEKVAEFAKFLGASDDMFEADLRNNRNIPQRIGEFIRAFSSILKKLAGSYDPLVNPIVNVNDFIAKVRWLASMAHCRAPIGTKPLEGQVPAELWDQVLEECIAKQSSMTTSVYSNNHLILNRMKSELERLHYISCYTGSSARPEPFNIGLIGSAGVGKSTWVLQGLTMAALKEMDYKLVDQDANGFDKRIYTTNPQDKFMSGYNPGMHPVVFIDEVASVLPGKVPAASDSIWGQILLMLGSAAHATLQAEASDKGKIFYRPLINVIASNQDDYGVGSYLAHQEAFWRRLNIVIKCRIRAIFRAEGLETLDLEKVSAYAAQNGLSMNDTSFANEFLLFKTHAGGLTPIYGPDEWVTYEETHDVLVKTVRAFRKKVESSRNVRNLPFRKKEALCKHGFFSCNECAEEKKRLAELTADVSPVIVHEEAAFFDEIEEDLDEQPFEIASMIDDHMEFIPVWLTAAWFMKDSVMVIWYAFLSFYYSVVNKVFQPAYDKLEEINQELKNAIELCGWYKTKVERAEKLLEQFRPNNNAYMIVFGLVSSAIFIKIVTAMMPTFVSADDEDEEVVVPHTKRVLSGELLGKPPGATNTVGNVWDVPKSVILYGNKSNLLSEAWESMILKATVVLKVSTTSNVHTCMGLGFNGSFLIGPWHTLKLLQEEGSKVQLIRISEKIDGLHHIMHHNPLYDMINCGHLVTQIGDTDVGVFNYTAAQSFANLLEAFPKKLNFPKSSSAECVVYGRKPKQESNYNPFIFSGLAISDEPGIRYPEGLIKHTGFTVKGELTPERGMCGSVVVIKQGKQSTIGGMMIAALIERNVYFFKPVLQGDLVKAMNTILDQTLLYSPASSLETDEMLALEGRQIGPLTQASQVHWMDVEEIGGLDVLCELPLEGGKQKSNVEWYDNAGEVLAALGPEFHHGLGIPRFDGNMIDGVWHHADKHGLRQMAFQAKNIDAGDLESAVADVIALFCKTEDFSKDMIIDMQSSLNGVPGNGYLKSMDLSTSSGFLPIGFPKGKKIVHTQDNPNMEPRPFEWSDQMQNWIRYCLLRMSAGCRIGFIMKYCIKDEPRKVEKIFTRDLRLFAAGPIDLFIISKMFFAMWMGIWMRNFNQHETVAGVNCFSRQWGDVYKRMSKFPNVILGDYSKYDKVMSINLIMAVFSVIIRVKKHFIDVNEEHLNVLKTIATECANPYILLSKAIIRVPGTLSSGLLLTLVINTIANMILHRLSWLKITGKSLSERAANVEFTALGDDNAISVSDYAISLGFTFRNIQKYFNSIGIKYTPANKSEEVYDYVSLSELSICKRKWLYDSEMDFYKCPIEKPTIGKMLTICVAGDSSKETAQSQAYESAQMEMAQYGREAFYDFQNRTRVLFPQTKLYTYDELMVRQMSYGLTPWHEERKSDYGEFDICSDQMKNKAVSATGTYNFMNMDNHVEDNIILKHEEKNGEEQRETVLFRENPDIYSISIDAQRDPSYNAHFTATSQLGEWLARPVEIYNFTWTTNYASRTIDLEFDPWSLWQSQPKVYEKMKNFQYFSCDLCLRFMIAGHPQQYGKLLVYYAPYGSLNVTGVFSDFTNPVYAAAKLWRQHTASGQTEQFFQYATQGIHGYLEPVKSGVLELKLPFIWHDNYIPVPASTGTGVQTSLGVITVQDMNPLRIAVSGAMATAKVTVMAWAENFKLDVPTYYPASGYEPLSSVNRSSSSSYTRKKRIPLKPKGDSDEYNNGPISTVASAVADVSEEVSKIPVIGRLVRATQIGAMAKGVGRVAKLLGFSTPVDQRFFPDRMIPTTGGRFAVIEGVDSSVPLSLDPKNEVTVDPRVCGAPAVDEMTFESICQRECYLMSPSWKSSGGQFGSGNSQLIFASLVHPLQTHVSGVSDSINTRTFRAVSDTPAALVARTFEYWKGDITYRVEVVASQFHNGRLLLTFEPNRHGSLVNGSLGSDISPHTQQSMILDLAESRSAEITIPYVSDKPWLRVGDSGFDDESWSLFSPVNNTETTTNLMNRWDETRFCGVFRVTVFQPLTCTMNADGTASDANAPVMVNIYHKCSNMRFAQPSNNMNWEDYQFAPFAEVGEPIPIGPFTVKSVNSEIFETSTEDENEALIFFGEKISSIRALMKRYTLCFAGNFDGNNTSEASISTRDLPLYSPCVIYNKDRINTFQSYFSPAYLIQRGSSRYKIFTYAVVNQNKVGLTGVAERNVVPVGSTGAKFLNSKTTVGTTTASATFISNSSKGAHGMTVNQLAADMPTEFQIPYYNPNRFHLGVDFFNVNNDSSETLLSNGSQDSIQFARFKMMGWRSNQDPWYIYYSVGEDYLLSMFMGTPMHYIQQ